MTTELSREKIQKRDAKFGEIDWICSCGQLFNNRDDAWKHPFNSDHVMQERVKVDTREGANTRDK